MNVTALLRIGRNVHHLESTARFYQQVLGFQPVGPVFDDPLLAELLGVEHLRLLRMRSGEQEIELSEIPGRSDALEAPLANDLAFQHIALATTDIAAASQRVMQSGVAAISANGPVHLPVSAGGVVAFKFRDPEGHGLEFLQFPPDAETRETGFDHSAISVRDVEQSVIFYERIGLVKTAQQVNQGPEQDALDGLKDVRVDVVALRPPHPAPHVELLCYQKPKGQLVAPYSPGGNFADRLVFATENDGLKMLRDPDGHVILLDARKNLLFQP